jgi:hypothetical protein
MASPRTVVTSNVARLKAMLPASSYMHLLHQGVMTGFLPRFDPEGKPTGSFDNLAPKDRVDLARYLLDKVVPDAPKELALVGPPPDPSTLTSPTALANLSSDELRRIAQGTTAEEETDVESPFVEAPPLSSQAGAG